MWSERKLARAIAKARKEAIEQSKQKAIAKREARERRERQWDRIRWRANSKRIRGW